MNKKKIFKFITRHPDIIFSNAIYCATKYYNAKQNKNILKMFFYGFKVNKYATKYNLELYGKFGHGLKIWHSNVIINGNAIIGDNVEFHGNNCVGSKNGKCPNIGDNVDIGYGAVIIGDVTIADNIVIGANSVVTKSFLEPGVVIAGCPAKIIKRCD